MARTTTPSNPNDVSNEQLHKDIAAQDTATEIANDNMASRLEAMERRMVERERSLDMREAELKKLQEQQSSTMGDRLKALESAVSPSLSRRSGGSGVQVAVQKGDWIAYDTRLGRGTNIQGGWVKCSQDDHVSQDVTNIGIARGAFVYDQAYGLPYHQAVGKSVGVQVVRKWFAGEGEKQMSPPYMLEPVSNIVRQPDFGIAVG